MTHILDTSVLTRLPLQLRTVDPDHIVDLWTVEPGRIGDGVDLWTVEPGRIGDGVDLWTVEPDRIGDRMEPFASCLDADERRRAAAIRNESRKRLFVAAHAGLRHILAGYLGIGPDTVAYSATGPAGKPCLHPALGSSLRFNMSHTHRLAIVAVADDREVGIDVEWTGRRSRELLMRWTRREAAAKLTGEGLGRILAERDPSPESAPHTFILLDLTPTDEHVGALAIAHPDARERHSIAR